MRFILSDKQHTILASTCTFLSVGAIALLTLGPSTQSAVSGGWACVFCSTFALADALANVLLFIPLGLSLRWLQLSAVKAITIGLCTTILVESAQLVLIPGRDASLGDLITNTVGCGLGHALLSARGWWLVPTSDRRALFIAGWYSALLMAIIVVTGLLMRRSFTDSEYYGQWTPRLGHLGWYRGSVIDARIGGLELPPTLMEHREAFIADWINGKPLTITAVAGPEPRILAPLFSIFDEHQREILLIGIDRADLVFRFRTASIAGRLHRPGIRLPGALQGVGAGDTISVSVWSQGHQFCVTLQEEEQCGLGFAVGSSWALMVESANLGFDIVSRMNLAWIALLVLPIGYWRSAGRQYWVLFSILLASLVILPDLSGLHPLSPHEWLAACVGSIAGYALGMIVRPSKRKKGPRSIVN